MGERGVRLFREQVRKQVLQKGNGLRMEKEKCLAAFKRMLEEIQKNYKNTEQKMAELKLQGKESECRK